MAFHFGMCLKNSNHAFLGIMHIKVGHSILECDYIKKRHSFFELDYTVAVLFFKNNRKYYRTFHFGM